MSNIQENVESKYKKVSIRENIRGTNWAAGSHKPIVETDIMFSTNKGEITAVIEKLEYPPSLYKIIDEPIVNVFDHANKNAKIDNKVGTLNPVTELRVEFKSTGHIVIYNNGKGIEVEQHKEAAMWLPEFLFSVPFQGKHNAKEAKAGIDGGANGIGVKLTNFLSSEFTVETYDGIYEYSQTWTKGADVRGDPIIKKVKHTRATPTYTRLTFLPDYAFYNINIVKFAPILTKLIFTRLVWSAAYSSYHARFIAKSKPIRIFFNNELIDIKSMKVLGDIVAKSLSAVDGSVVSCDIADPTQDHFPIEACIVIIDIPTKLNEVSVVNGVVCRESAHYKPIMSQLVKQTATVVKKDTNGFKPEYLKQHTLLLCNCAIAQPQWEGQRKEKYKMPADYFKQLDIPATFVKNSIKGIKQIIIDKVNEKQDKKNEKPEGLESDPNKLWDAPLAGKDKRAILAIVEGDSAMGALKTGILKNTKINHSLIGALVANGVITNARKQIKLKTTAKKQTYIQKSDKLINNKFFKTFLYVSGLNLNYKYDPISPTYEVEMAALRYRGGIFGCCDQDLDGHNIFGLLMNMAAVFWPKLLESGYFHKLATPIVRLYKKKSKDAPICIYEKLEYDTWLAQNKLTEETLSRDYDIKYYKGLGSHNRVENEEMYKNLYDNMYKITCVNFDFNLDELLEIWGLNKNTLKVLANDLNSARDPDDIWNSSENAGFDASELDSIPRDPDHDDTKSECGSESSITTRTLDIFEICYGHDTAIRKLFLGRDYPTMSNDNYQRIKKSKEITVVEYLTTYVQPYQRDNIARKLDSLDGFNQTARKIFDGSYYKHFHKGGDHLKSIKTKQLAGLIAKEEAYLHGEQSIEDMIGGRALITVGGNQIPLFVPDGVFGSRLCGGKDAASSRYTFVKYNRVWDIIFPKLDYPLLDFHFEEGARCEPKNFSPIIPMILESRHLPATGWKLQLWGRDVFSVIENARTCVKFDSCNYVSNLAPDLQNWTGELRYYRRSLYSFGVFVLDAQTRTVVITELPYRVWTNNYVKWLHKLMKKYPDIISSIDSAGCDGDNVKIKVKFKIDGIAAVEKSFGDDDLKPFEAFLGLYCKMQDHINLLSHTGEQILMLKSYGEIFKYWYPLRKEIYGKRVARTLIVMQMREIYLKHYSKYLLAGLDMKNLEESEMEAMLSGLGYPKIYTGIMNNPGFEPTERLMELFLAGPKISYNYILDTTERGKSKAKIASVAQSYEKVRAEIADFERIAANEKFPGQKYWMEELDILEREVALGIKTQWLFE